MANGIIDLMQPIKLRRKKLNWCNRALKVDFVYQNVAQILLLAFTFLGDGFTEGTHVLAVERFGEPGSDPIIFRIGDRHPDPGNRLQSG